MNNRFERIHVEMEQVEVEYHRSVWDSIKEEFLAKKIGIVCVAILLLITIASLCAPLAKYDPNAIDATNKLQGISMEHWFGTDEYGRDCFARALSGGRISIGVGLVTMVLSVVVGTIIGTIAGYAGGKVDMILMRLTDVFLAIPSYLVALVLNIILKPSMVTLVVILAIFSWAPIARITRAETMTLKQRDFVQASKNLGAGNRRIIFQHIIPNMVGPICVAATLVVANAILAESFLSFLGLGVQLPQASWGSMLQGAQKYMLTKPLVAVIPGILILLVVLSFNVIGEILQSALGTKKGK
jgi:peptide/nickel transport system permease protein